MKKKSLIITIILYYSNTRAPVMIDKYTEKTLSRKGT